ncbi:LysR family transcriptional regulator [Telluria mixta]|uniref:LysR family transcriptional regulator n=1 Tax=Telluria mixta TaxID=34071 RepID=A0ABT2BS14_9BURK|nr:LysR family transcriptional regulator [Telluria mixta]MCS0627914.1 LysR family transcriptional regulator [Telluria mixta]WEM93967.1 LysR family transcriptional regulator [Telluria mixta]
MRFNKLDLNLLVVLNALLTERSISRAAAKIHLSQPATSNALARLRDYFGDELLVSSGRQLLLTSRAESLIEPVREVLMRIDSTIATQPEFDPALETRSFTLLASDFTTTILIPPLLESLFQAAPGVRIHMRSVTYQAGEMLEQGKADFLIAPSQFLSKNHPSSTLFEEEYVCVTWSRHTHVREQLTLNDYLSCGHVTLNLSAGQQGSAFDSWFIDSFDVKRRIEVTAPTMAALPALVIGTDRIATVHRRVAEQASTYLPVTIWEPPLKIPHLVQMLQWHKYKSNDPATTWMRERLTEVAERIWAYTS